MTNIVRFLILPAASAPAGVGDCQRTITTVRTEANEDKVISTTWGKNNDIHQNSLDSRALIPHYSAMPTPSFALQ